MFQRKANLKPAAITHGHINSMNLVLFFKTAKEDFERRGKTDEAFILEMLEEHFREAKPSLSYSSRIFGL